MTRTAVKTVRLTSRQVAEALSANWDVDIAAEQRRMDALRERREVAEALWDAYADWAYAPRPTSALLDGSAAERRRRRIERREIASAARALLIPLVIGLDGEEAA